MFLDYKLIGSRLEDARKNLNITLEESAQKIGITKSTMLRWENGEVKNLKLPMLEKLALYYNVSYHWLIGQSDKKYVSNDNLIPTTDTNIMFPIVGKVSAGLPILAVENIEGYEVAPSSYVKHGFEYFYLRVQGDSMNIKIPEGSLVLVQKQDALENDEIGVFRIDNDDVTVKKFKKEDNIISLIPISHNPIHKIQKYDLTKDKIDIVGRVVFYIGKL